ncbi:MAG: hypothetical protein AB2N28_2330 [Candidatus Phytoplasma solani]
MAKKIIKTKKTKPKAITSKKVIPRKIKKPKKTVKKTTTKPTIIKKTSTRITKTTPKTTKPITKTTPPQPTKIIVETQQKQDNWFVKIIKILGKAIIVLLPILLIGGGIYWVLFKFFPEIFTQINAFTGDAAAKTKSLYDKATQPIYNFIKHIHNKITGNDKDPNHTPSPQNKLGYYLATTLSVIGICLGIGKIGNWLKGGAKKAIRKGTKKTIQKKATSKIANVGSKICKIGGKVLFWVSLALTAYELYQFYQEETQNPNPPQQLTHKMENPPTPIFQNPSIQQQPNNELSTIVNPIQEETNQEERITGNLDNP